MAQFERFTASGESECDRCFQDILDGEYAGRLDGTVICSCCADDLEDGIGTTPELPTGLAGVREAVRRARGGDAPPQILGYA